MNIITSSQTLLRILDSLSLYSSFILIDYLLSETVPVLLIFLRKEGSEIASFGLLEASCLGMESTRLFVDEIKSSSNLPA